MNKRRNTGLITSLAAAACLSTPASFADAPIGQRVAGELGRAIAVQGDAALAQIRRELRDKWLGSLHALVLPEAGSRDDADGQRKQDPSVIDTNAR